VRIVLDSNILVRANPLVSPLGLARDLLLKIVAGPHVLVLSPAILTEVHRVLKYPNVQSKWPLAEDDIDRCLAFLETAAIVVDLPHTIAAFVSDPDDDPIVQTAITGQADVLCTRDQAFHHQAVQDACSVHNIRILDDLTLMHELRQLSKE